MVYISKEDLYQYYIVKNNKLEDTAKYFNINLAMAGAYVKVYGFNKKKKKKNL